MKPNFALTLSFDGIGLLHRVPGGWHLVGDVALDAPDLSAALAVLRRTAIQLDNAGLRCKLVIPNEQIRYLKLAAPAKGTDMAAHVARALDGATPYPVADLRFDWIVVGEDLHVAAVARETLDEAEAFAAEHDFGPVSFVAIPAADAFPGEPFFGPTDAAPRLIAPGDRLLRDTHPIRILGRTDPPAMPEAAAQDTAPPAETVADPATAVPATAAPADVVASNVVASDVADSPAQDAATAPAQPDAPQPDAPQPDAADPLPAFSTRRAKTTTPEAVTAATALSDTAQPIPAIAPSLPDQSPAAAPVIAAPVITAPVITAPVTASPVTAPKLSASTTDKDATPRQAPTPDPTLRPAAFRSVPASPAGDTDKSGYSLSTLLARLKSKTATPKIAASTDRAVTPPAGASAPQLSEKQRLTIFGARTSEGGAIRGKPRFLGMILTGALLLFMAAVATWASIFTETGLKGLFGPRDSAIAILPDPAPPQDSAQDSAQPTEQPALQPQNGPDAVDLARLQDDQTLSNLTDDLPAETDTADTGTAPTDPLPDGSEAAALPQVPAVGDAMTSYAATGIWQIAPDQPQVASPGTLDDLYLASIDTRLQNFDAVALPDGRAPTDQRPPAQSNPAAPGTTFDLDQRGLVIATPEGAETAEGVMVFAGRPAVTPAGMPTRFARTPGIDPDPEAASEPAQAPAGTRPRLRPDTLIESNERAQLGGLSRDELGDLRPRPRPATLAAVALALREASPLVGTDPDPEAAEDEADASETATAQAIASSLKPLARPRDFSETVESSRTAPQQVAAAALSAPRSAAPQIPSSASVAQQATVRGAINLRQVNLIGVYGQPSNRRALVRLSNGRYQKVQVGDRLDGGQVRAIGESELSYVKGNRAIVLTMPQG